jgi:hypothetical protein
MTIAEIKRINAAAGQHYFSPDTMRFFRSQVHGPARVTKSGRVYFVTSEQREPDCPRLYTVREFYPETGDIKTRSQFQQFKSPGEARTFIRGLVKAEVLPNA